MSGGTGRRHLARHNAYIVITANSYRLDHKVSHLLDDLAVPVVPKPFDMDSLLENIASAARKIAVH